jgi:type IV pilus assembly protein PilQ
LQVIADFTNFNVVTSDTVTGNVTLRLKDVPWDQALDIIMQSKGLGVRKNGNVLWIAPKDELAAKEQVDLEAKKKVAELEPLRTQAFQLNYTKAEDIAKGLTGQNAAGSGRRWRQPAGNTTRILSPPGQRDLRDAHQPALRLRHPVQARRDHGLIAKIDIPVRQVLIEARIVEADDSFGRALGVKLGAVDLRGRRAASRLWAGRQLHTPSAATTRTLGGRPASRIPPTSATTRSSSTCRPAPGLGATAATLACRCSVPRPTAS